jgi:hypothetical protein
VRRRLLDGIDKERGAGWRFVEHTASIAEFMVQLELAVRGRDDLRILETGEILEDAPKSNQDRLVRVEASIRLGGALRKSHCPIALSGSASASITVASGHIQSVHRLTDTSDSRRSRRPIPSYGHAGTR